MQGEEERGLRLSVRELGVCAVTTSSGGRGGGGCSREVVLGRKGSIAVVSKGAGRVCSDYIQGGGE